MTCQTQDTEALSAVELIAERGKEGLPDALAALINEAVRLKRERFVSRGATGAESGEIKRQAYQDQRHYDLRGPAANIWCSGLGRSGASVEIKRGYDARSAVAGYCYDRIQWGLTRLATSTPPT